MILGIRPLIDGRRMGGGYPQSIKQTKPRKSGAESSASLGQRLAVHARQVPGPPSLVAVRAISN
jgi:hypothetical protein